MPMTKIERVRAALSTGQLAGERIVALELVQEARHRRRVVAGARQIAHAELVGLELLVARIARQI